VNGSEWDEEKEGVHVPSALWVLLSLDPASKAKAEQAKAEFNNGVLEVRVPIPQQQQTTRQIPIEGGSERKPLASQASAQQATHSSKAG
jgi:hypothetical protein